jgi:hypothetical protein
LLTVITFAFTVFAFAVFAFAVFAFAVFAFAVFAFSLFLTERNCTYHVNDGLADGLEVDCCTTVMGRAPPGTLEDGHLQALFSSRKALV